MACGVLSSCADACLSAADASSGVSLCFKSDPGGVQACLPSTAAVCGRSVPAIQHNPLSLQVGEEFNRISLGLCNEATLPYLLQAAPFAGVDILRFQKAMQETMRDKKQVSITFQLLDRDSV